MKAYLVEGSFTCETLFGLIVGGGHIVDVEEGKELIGATVRIGEALPEIFGAGMGERVAAEKAQPTLKTWFAAFGPGERDGAGVARVGEATAIVKEVPDVLAEG